MRILTFDDPMVTGVSGCQEWRSSGGGILMLDVDTYSVLVFNEVYILFT